MRLSAISLDTTLKIQEITILLHLDLEIYEISIELGLERVPLTKPNLFLAVRAIDIAQFQVLQQEILKLEESVGPYQYRVVRVKKYDE